MSLKWIAQRLPMGGWTCVSNLLRRIQPWDANAVASAGDQW